jgi:NAD(P)-dependent dehydrogenase (short-subunit alcohol dehydrogenase family)
VSVLDLNRPSGPHGAYIQTDLADRSSVDTALTAIDRPVNALFNNAGVNSSVGFAPP